MINAKRVICSAVLSIGIASVVDATNVETVDFAGEKYPVGTKMYLEDGTWVATFHKDH